MIDNIFSLLMGLTLSTDPIPEFYEQTQQLASIPIKGSLEQAYVDERSNFILLKSQTNIGTEYWLYGVEEGNLVSLAVQLQPLDSHTILNSGWSHGKLMFSTSDALLVIDPQTQASQKYALPYRDNMPFMAWSNKYALPIWGTNVLNKQPADEKSSRDKATQPFQHASQTGLFITEDGSHFVTSGFHDQTIKTWSLPDGELLSDVNFDGWFSNKKIRSFALIEGGLFFTTEDNTLEWLPDGETRSKASYRPCDGHVHVKNSVPASRRTLFYVCSQSGAFGLLRISAKGKVKLKPLSIRDPQRRFSSGHFLFNERQAVIVFNTGQFSLIEIPSGKTIQNVDTGNHQIIRYLPHNNSIVAFDDKQLTVWMPSTQPSNISSNP